VSRSLEWYRDALARGDEFPAELELELAAAEVAAIERSALVELLDDLALHERALRARSRQ
jgi:hypothetical protein